MRSRLLCIFCVFVSLTSLHGEEARIKLPLNQPVSYHVDSESAVKQKIGSSYLEIFSYKTVGDFQVAFLQPKELKEPIVQLSLQLKKVSFEAALAGLKLVWDIQQHTAQENDHYLVKLVDQLVSQELIIPFSRNPKLSTPYAEASTANFILDLAEKGLLLTSGAKETLEGGVDKNTWKYTYTVNEVTDKTVTISFVYDVALNIAPTVDDSVQALEGKNVMKGTIVVDKNSGVLVSAKGQSTNTMNVPKEMQQQMGIPFSMENIELTSTYTLTKI